MTTRQAPRTLGDDVVLLGSEVALVLRCSLRTVQRLVAAGELVAVRDGERRRRYLRRDVMDYLERHRRTSAPESA